MARRVGERPLAVGAGLIVALEALLGSAGASAPLLSVAALVLAPGLALAPLLPARVHESPLAVLAAAPVLGIATSSVMLITLSSAGVSLDPTAIRLALGSVVAVGLLLPWPEAFRPPSRADLPAAAGLALALALGAVLQQRVIGGDPIPGNDWAKYLLYGDEIAAHRELLITNPFWMLGVPFREDPGVPALYGSFLSLTGEPASTLAHGIWVFAIASILAMCAFARAFWGDLAGVIAAGLWAVLPISQDILAWHGAPNLAAICLLALILVYLAVLTTDGLGLGEAVGLGLLLVALAATHRLTALVGAMAIVVALAWGLVASEPAARRRILRSSAVVCLAALLLSPGVLYDLIERARTFGGTQDYRAYLSAKVNLGPVAGDLSVIFTVMAVAALVYVVRLAARDRAVAVLLSLLAVVIALAYSWLFEIPTAYFRMAYYLPLALVPLVALALVRLLTPRRAAVAAGVASLAIAVFAWVQGGNVRDFYAFTNDASLRGLDAVTAQLRNNEVVVTDRCWSFQATWLLHTRTLPALEPEDIQPKAELRRAREARAVLDGTPAGLALARRLGVRYLIVDPTCVDTRERPTRPPAVGTPLFVSKRLVVLRLPKA
jgi:hypothetical protein